MVFQKFSSLFVCFSSGILVLGYLLGMVNTLCLWLSTLQCIGVTHSLFPQPVNGPTAYYSLLVASADRERDNRLFTPSRLNFL